MLQVRAARPAAGGPADRTASGDMELPELGRILAGDCRKTAAVSISDRCDVFFPKLGAF